MRSKERRERREGREKGIKSKGGREEEKEEGMRRGYEVRNGQ